MDLRVLRETDENVVILPGARVNGSVTFGPGCSVWYNAVIRGDNEYVSMGKNCNVQDNCVFHPGKGFPIVLEDDVTVGHGAILHGCTVGSGSLIGMGAILLNGSRIGKNCIVGAGALVTGKMDAPDGSMILGNPAKVVRPITEDELAMVRRGCRHYVELREQYR